MMKKRTLINVLSLIILLLVVPGSAQAQNYSFSLDQQTVDLYMNTSGTVDIDYTFVFTNDNGASPIDFIDVGFPNSSYNLSNVTAEVDGQPIRDIERSPYVEDGVALGLGSNAIPPGQRGTARVSVDGVENMFFTDNTDESYASMQFSTTWFDSQFVHGASDVAVTFHFPPGLQPEEPRWHNAPEGFPQEPETGIDDQGRIFYTWRNPNASGDRPYLFGASLPKSYLPASEVSSQTEVGTGLVIDEGLIFTLLFCGGVGGFILLIIFVSVAASRRRKLQYLPPKMSIGGHGVKRGLTAVEAAVLLETPMDKILTMTLFAVIKKGAASVKTQDPLELEIVDPLPDNLRAYEKNFLEAFKTKDRKERRRDLQDMMVSLVSLVKSVAQKMKGFSKRETVDYYRDIMKRAWSQVEAADTPEVKSEKFDEVMEWTMLDRDFNDRTQEVFRGGPVFVPVWWGRYDPGFGRGAAPRTSSGSGTSAPSGSPGGGVSLPTLPGGAFAANMVNGIQNFSSNVVGNLTDFTSRITNKTNPPPPPSKSSGGWRSGGGSSCACACAGCACACACAGGGR
jgi:hypothetical protein